MTPFYVKRKSILPRATALLLALAFAAPHPAYALRPTGLEEQEINGEATGHKKELVTSLTSPASVQPLSSASGLEEKEKLANHLSLVFSLIRDRLMTLGEGQGVAVAVGSVLKDEEVSVRASVLASGVTEEKAWELVNLQAPSLDIVPRTSLDLLLLAGSLFDRLRTIYRLDEGVTNEKVLEKLKREEAFMARLQRAYLEDPGRFLDKLDEETRKRVDKQRPIVQEKRSQSLIQKIPTWSELDESDALAFIARARHWVESKAGLEEWKELAFHLARLENPDVPVGPRSQAASAILKGLRDKRPTWDQTLDIIRRFQVLLNRGGDFQDSARELVWEGLVYAGCDRPEILDLVLNLARNPAASPRMICLGFEAFHLRIWDEMHNPWLLGPVLPQVLAALQVFLSRPELDQESAFKVMHFLSYICRPSSGRVLDEQGKEAIRRDLATLLRQDQWIETLKGWYGRPDFGARIYAASLLLEIGEDIEDEHRTKLKLLDDIYAAERSGDGTKVRDLYQEIVADIESRDSSLIPLEVRLNAQQIGQLKEQVSTLGDLPGRLLEQLFIEERKRMTFVSGAIQNMPFREGKGLLRDLLRLCETGQRPVVLALPIPVDWGGADDVLTRVAGLPENTFSDADPIERESDRFMLWLRGLGRARSLIDGKILLEFYGAAGNLSGENRFDSQVENLKRVLGKHPKSPVVVYDQEVDADAIVLSSRNLEATDGQPRLSLAVALTEYIGRESVATVIQESMPNWEGMREDWELHNLADFAETMPTSFGVRISGTLFESIRFNPEYRDTYDAWDALVFYREDDGEDPDFFAPPRIPEPESLTPDGVPTDFSPPVPVASGLEEMQLAELFRSVLQEARVTGSWAPPEGPAPVVFSFEHANTRPWAPLAAQAGAPVAVMVESSTEAEELRALFRGFGIPEERFIVVPMDVAIDRETAVRRVQAHFQRAGLPPVELVTLDPNAHHDRIEEILKGYGLRFDTAPIPLLIVIDRYLSALA